MKKIRIRIYVETGLVFDWETDVYESAKAVAQDLYDLEYCAKTPDDIEVVGDYLDFNGALVHRKAKIIGLVDIED